MSRKVPNGVKEGVGVKKGNGDGVKENNGVKEPAGLMVSRRAAASRSRRNKSDIGWHQNFSAIFRCLQSVHRKTFKKSNYASSSRFAKSLLL